MLICRVGTKRCALPLSSVEETLRPLPIQALAGAPEFVLGLTMLRGFATPVIDASHLLTHVFASAPTRFVSLRLGTRRAALAVDEVIGVRQVQSQSVEKLPPLLADVSEDVLASVTRLDGELLLILRAAHFMTETAP